jgi:hypothetical protein
MTDNLAIWNKLGKTDPDQTKAFQRGGGFKGTAIKPVYTEQKMTEVFGPCGTGWGFTEPRFELVTASEGQTAVYCWLSLWYVHNGVRSEPIPGVGGDFVVVKQRDGLRTNDEAFKAAFTDAIGNAMKHLGMSADVHMGLFDDSKYVRSLREDKEPAGNPASRGAGAVSSPQAPAPANRTPGGETLAGREAGAVKQGTAPASITQDQATFIDGSKRALALAESVTDVAEWEERNKPEAARLGFRRDNPAGVALRKAINDRIAEIELADMPAGQLEVAE